MPGTSGGGSGRGLGNAYAATSAMAR
uniref:Uncharacterized protein n=1 Tax=Arundo donax TaxID=35708 RepID=A0A0A9ARI2_ARUDO